MQQQGCGAFALPKKEQTMNDLPKDLPGDAAEYLRSAAETIAKEQQFQPSSLEEMKGWLDSNFKEIATRASELQTDLLNKLGTSEGKKVKNLMSMTVWTAIRHRELVSGSNAVINKVIWQ
jgi:hypothetical protein